MNSDQKADSTGIASRLTPAAIFLAKVPRKEHQIADFYILNSSSINHWIELVLLRVPID
ncbi:hypothetical protein [Nostoc punctiforme]|uniref:hypothetical protein n=1 Tax=Nostoc punctiforme TaxID=272131 RepID=UPI000045BC40|nr:hypothetical protein [Nostoc punctiforme]